MDNIKFEKNTFKRRFLSMLKVDFLRMWKSLYFYIIIGICLVAPILILVMTTMMDGTVSVNPETGEETVIEGFDNVWQIFGSVSGGDMSGAEMEMGLTTMCNINILYFGIAALVCIFVADEYRCGYIKNLFTVRAKKSDYVISKTLTLFVGSACMVLAFVIGALLGGKISGLPFELVGFNLGNLIFCILSKVVIVAVFVPIYLLMSVIAKQRLWLSIILSMGVGMLLFMMIPMLTPLNAGIVNVLLCILGGAALSVGLGAVSNLLLKKTALI